MWPGCPISRSLYIGRSPITRMPNNVPLQMNSVIGGGSGTLKTSYAGYRQGSQTYPVHYNGNLSKTPVAIDRGGLHPSLAGGMKVQKMLTPVSFSYLGQRVNNRTATGSTLLDALAAQAGRQSQSVVAVNITTPGLGYVTAIRCCYIGRFRHWFNCGYRCCPGPITAVVINNSGTGYTIGNVVTVVQGIRGQWRNSYNHFCFPSL